MRGLSLGTGMSAQTAASQSNLIDGFESWSMGLPSGWTQTLGTGTAEQSTENVTQGTYAAKMTCNEDDTDGFDNSNVDLSGFNTVYCDLTVTQIPEGAGGQFAGIILDGTLVDSATPSGGSIISERSDYSGLPYSTTLVFDVSGFTQKTGCYVSLSMYGSIATPAIFTVDNLRGA